jgi:MFS family permease
VDDPASSGVDTEPATDEQADQLGLAAEPAPGDVTLAPAAAPPPGRQGLAAIRPLRHRNFALLWSGGLVSVVGSWMQTVAVGALVVAHTGKALWAVLIAAGGFLPIGLLSPIGGALADRVARRPVLVLGNLAAGAVALTIAELVATGHDGPWVLTVLVTLQGAVSAVTSPFQQAILPDLVPRSEFLAASSLGSAQFNLGRVLGPVLAGTTIAAFGYPMAFVANAVSFLAVVVALAFIRLGPPPAEGRGVPLLRSLRLGWHAAIETPACRAAILTIAIVAFLASPFIALVPAMAHRVVHGGARSLAGATAVLTTAQGVGAVLGAVLLAPVALRIGREKVLVASIAALPVALVLYGLSTTLVWATVSLFAVGLVYIGVLSSLSTTVQLSAPNEYRGRILSIYLVALGVAYPIGSLLQGPLADRIGLGWTTCGTALALVVVMASVLVIRPGALRALTEPELGRMGEPTGV